jgi:hypothetical protein
MFVDQGEAEAAFASGHDQAVHWGKSVGEGANGILSVDSGHIIGVPTNDTDKNRATLKRSSNVDHH